MLPYLTKPCRRRPPHRRCQVCRRSCASTSRWRSPSATAKIPTSAPRFMPTAQGWESPGRANSRARNSASTTSSISTPAGSWRRSSTNRLSLSSSTPTPAARPPAQPSSKPTQSAGLRPGLGLWLRHRHQPHCGRRRRRGDRQALCRGYRRSRLLRRGPRALQPPRRTCAWSKSTPRRPRPVVKHVSGGLLLQDADTGRIDAAALDPGLKIVTWRPPTAEELRSLLFAWRVCKHVKSNAIVYARDGQTLGVGAGQMSRVDAARFGAMKAILPLKGCVAASDAFFPFPDGLEAVAQAGATAVIQPGGSVRDQDVIARRRPAGHGHGLHRNAPLPALKAGRNTEERRVSGNALHSSISGWNKSSNCFKNNIGNICSKLEIPSQAST